MLSNGTYTRTEGAPPGGVYPRFYMEAVQDELASANAGHACYREEERVEIILPGNPLTCPVHRVNDEHRFRWAREYAAFKEGIEAAPDGIPIEEWPILNRAQVMELRALKIRTVEQMSQLPDTATQRAMGLAQLREKARAFLDDAAAIALTERVTKENDTLRNQVSTLTRQVEELGAATTQMHAELMAMRNAPHPLATTAPMSLDPLQAGRLMAAGDMGRGAPQSSLGEFAETRRRPGRPRRDRSQDEAGAA